MIHEDHKRNRIQMKWRSIKANTDEYTCLAFIDTPELQRIKAKLEEEPLARVCTDTCEILLTKRGVYTNEEWLKVINNEFEHRNKVVKAAAYVISQKLSEITPKYSRLSIITNKILQRIVTTKD